MATSCSDLDKDIEIGKTPYSRKTYRYTPLLAWALLPNVTVHSTFGKFLFAVFDLMAGRLIWTILRQNGCTENVSKILCLSYLLNPMSMVVSCRGNAESVVVCLVLYTICLLQQRKITTAAIMYAISVHTKIYPVTFAPVIYLFLGSKDMCVNAGIKTENKFKHKFFYTSKNFLRSLSLTKEKLKFLLVTGATFLSLTGFFYFMYGWEFLYETYLYHVARRDSRHNFSPFFYMLYLTSEVGFGLWVKFLIFIPQLLQLITIAIHFHGDLPLSCFLSTFTFVSLNKVCTSQYFLWYLNLLPLLVPRLHIRWQKAAAIGVVWFAAQGPWLLSAYYLEFHGRNTFIYIWLACLAFFAVNIYSVVVIITNYDYTGSVQSSKTDHTY